LPSMAMMSASASTRLLTQAWKQALNNSRQHPDRQEEPGSAGDPAFAVGCDPAAREAMQMGGGASGSAPGVQHGQEAISAPRYSGSAAMVRSASNRQSVADGCDAARLNS
jgi:hypothetical protein